MASSVYVNASGGPVGIAGRNVQFLGLTVNAGSDAAKWNVREGGASGPIIETVQAGLGLTENFFVPGSGDGRPVQDLYLEKAAGTATTATLYYT
jgi:hypothetical protein